MAMLLLVKTGAVVTWTNTDDEPHIVSCDRAQTRSAVETDEKLTFVCEAPGTYHFTCSTHPRVILTLVVE